MTLDQLEALANAATPGPWFSCDFTQVTQDKSDAFEISCTWPDFIGVAAITSGGYKGTREQKDNDCWFIAAANPQTIKALIALCRMQHEVVENADALRHEIDFSTYLKRVKMVAEMANEALTAFEQFGKEFLK
jgi:hypothetical protein